MNTSTEGQFFNIFHHDPDSALENIGLDIRTSIEEKSSILIVGMGSGALEKLIKKTRNDLLLFLSNHFLV